MNILLYFGSFNPIHKGHVGLAEYMLGRDDVDEVWLVLSPHNPLKDVAGLWDEQKRLELVEKACEQHKGLKACTVEFGLPKPNYTINTLRYLARQFPGHRFSMLMGADNYEIFDKWKSWQEILSNYKIFVYPRSGSNRIRGRFEEMEWLMDAPLFNISSTEIRNRIARGECVDDLLP